jgi:hypothetical protein
MCRWHWNACPRDVRNDVVNAYQAMRREKTSGTVRLYREARERAIAAVKASSLLARRSPRQRGGDFRSLDAIARERQR